MFPRNCLIPSPLRLYAELADGSLHLCFAQRSQLFTSEEEKHPILRKLPQLLMRP